MSGGSGGGVGGGGGGVTTPDSPSISTPGFLGARVGKTPSDAALETSTASSLLKNVFGREKERERERQTDRQTDRQAESQTNRLADRHTDRKKQKETVPFYGRLYPGYNLGSFSGMNQVANQDYLLMDSSKSDLPRNKLDLESLRPTLIDLCKVYRIPVNPANVSGDE